jgi:cytochrome c-type biogenesis protein
MVDIALLGYAFGVGMIAFLNPCGFALLPAYVAHYLSHGGRGESSGLERGLRGVKLGLAMSAGFFTVFVGLGLGLALAGRVLSRYIMTYTPWIGAGVGVMVLLLGLAMLLKREFSLELPVAGLAAKLRGGRKPSDHSLVFYYIYGISYAIGSLGCTLPLFLSVTLTAFTTHWVNGLANFLAYAGGMTLMMLAFSLVMVYARELMQHYFERAMRFVRPVSAWVLLGLGLYLIWYQLIYSGVLGS